MLKNLLENKHCFKLVCGAGNEDVETIKRLVYTYALGGCRFFDICADLEIVNAAKEVLKNLNINDAFLCVSIGIKGDLHLNKAEINPDKCVKCGSCENICPQNAIKYFKVKKIKCIGCEKCKNICPKQAISLHFEEKNLEEILPKIIETGIDCIEFHVDTQGNEEEILSIWEYLNAVYSGFLSICVSRRKLGDEQFLSRIKKMLSSRKDFSTIIQADGFPMSGGKDDFKTTLQAIAAAEIVQNANLPVYLLLSGGTNSKTAQLAELCGIDYNGISIGSYARKIVNKYIQREDFWKNEFAQKEAVKIAKDLIDTV